jgi:hypothetical protein
VRYDREKEGQEALIACMVSGNYSALENHPNIFSFFLSALIVGQILWPVGIKYWASYNRF